MASNPKTDPAVRNIKIKTGVVKRLSKERDMYEKEVNQQTAKVQKMKEEGKDEYDIRKQTEVLHESQNMIPDIERKLKSAHDELTGLLETQPELSNTEEYQTASELLKTVKIDL